MWQFSYWIKGVRLYIAIASVVVTLEAAWWANVTFGGTALFALRLEELFAWLSVSCLAAALCIGPLYRLFPTLPAKQIMREARRLIGLSAAWFAAWHAGLAYHGLFSQVHWAALTPQFKWGFGLGITGLVALLILAAISFDAALRRMGVWWFRVQRLVYVAGVVVVAHALLIGAQTAVPWVRVLLALVVLLVAGLHGAVLVKGHGHAVKK